jgi:NADPH:quinone reductase-like Zn-dependent oxidoreductase
VTAVEVDYAPGGASPAHRYTGSVFAYVVSGQIRSENSAADLDSLASLMESGQLHTCVGEVLRLDAARQAHEMLEGSRAKPTGKVVLDVS